MLVFYELTRACDLVCQHCRACAQKRRDPNELGTNQSKRLIDQLREFPDPPMLILTGGDPLKRADVYERLAGYPTLALAGSALSGVGVPSCIESGQNATKRVVHGLRQCDANQETRKEDLPACS